MNAPTKDLTPVNPKKLRCEFSHALRALFLLGLLAPMGSLALLAEGSPAREIYQCPHLIGISVGLMFLCIPLLYLSAQRVTALIAYPLFTLACGAVFVLTPATEGINDASSAIAVLLGAALLLSFARGYALSLGPVQTAYQRILLAECILALGALFGIGLLALAGIPALAEMAVLADNPSIIVLSLGGLCVLCGYVKLLRSKKADVKPWEGSGSGLINKASLGSLGLYLINTTAWICACGQVAQQSTNHPLAYGAGIVLALMIGRFVGLCRIGKGKKMSLFIAQGVGLAAACACIFVAENSLGGGLCYALLILASLVLAPTNSILLAWGVQNMGEKQIRGMSAFYSFALILAFFCYHSRPSFCFARDRIPKERAPLAEGWKGQSPSLGLRGQSPPARLARLARSAKA